MSPVFGKHRGLVTSARDPLQMGRVEVKVPSLTGESTMWAMPSVPFAGRQTGVVFLPAEGSGVWVEFEGGDLDRPIWTGCFWHRGEFPSAVTEPTTRVLRTAAMTLTVNDAAQGSVTLELLPPAAQSPTKIVLEGAGITLTYGSSSVKLSASGVSINDGALDVT